MNRNYRIIQYLVGVAFICALIFAGETFRERKNARKKSPQSVTVCKEELKRVLNDIKTKEKNLSDLAETCYQDSSKKSCEQLNQNSKELISFLDGNDLGQRWQWFSCSPLLFSKLRLLRNQADQLGFLTHLKRPTKDLLIQGKSILEPGMFFNSALSDTEKRCCE
jgi:hypothetical protein